MMKLVFASLLMSGLGSFAALAPPMSSVFVKHPRPGAELKAADGIDIQVSYDNKNGYQWLWYVIYDANGQEVAFDAVEVAQGTGEFWFPNTGPLPNGQYTIIVVVDPLGNGGAKDTVANITLK